MSISTQSKQEGLVLIRTGEHACRVLSKQDAKEQDSSDPYAVVLQSKKKVVEDIRRLAMDSSIIERDRSVLIQEKRCKFNGQNLEAALEKFYNENYKKKNGDNPFLEYIKINAKFARLTQDFFEADKDSQGMGMPPALAELLMQTLTAEAFFHRLATALPKVMWDKDRFINDTDLQREINIFFDSKSNEINIYEQYSVQKIKNVNNMQGPAESATLKTLSHVRVEMDVVGNKPKVFAEYYAIASGADLQYAAAIIEEVIPKGQNSRNSGAEDMQGQTALHHAVLSKDLNLVRTLLDGKLVEAINAKDSKGKTALHYAAEQNDEALVLALADRGADLSLRDNRQKRAHQYAAKNAPVKQFLKALTLVEGYLKHEKDMLIQDETKMEIAQGLRDCMVEDPFYNRPTSIEDRKIKIATKMSTENTTEGLKSHKYNRVATWFGRLMMDLAKILNLNSAKEQSKDIIVPQKGESHGAAFCNKLSAVVLNPGRQRPHSEPALRSLLPQRPGLNRTQSCSSFFWKKTLNKSIPPVHTFVQRPIRRP